MKEATGELNSTVVVVAAVSLLAAFFFTVLWPSIKNNMNQNTKCSKAWCDKCNDSNGCSTVTCHYMDGNTQKDITCVWKG